MLKEKLLEDMKISMRDKNVIRKNVIQMVRAAILQVEKDKQIELEEINMKIIKSLELLKPFGEGNRIPLFSIKNIKIDSIRALSEGKHLKVTLKNKNTYIDAIGFNLGNLVNELRIGDKINIVGSLEINSFNGCDRIQINLKDIMKSL